MAVSEVFTALRREPELVTPAKPTPHELKLLSDVDDQQGLRMHANMILLFRSSPSMAGVDPARVVREAVAKALVYYYPLAGRLREGPGRKLVVECTGEGVLFVEADADIQLEQFGAEPQPPFPCVEELIYGCGGLLSSPLLSIQVTRLKCGGFIFAVQVNHTIADGAGLAQFLKAVGEIAQGADSPTLRPVWAREMLMAQDPPHVTHEHPEYDHLADENAPARSANVIVRSFFFGPREMSIMRQHLPPHLHTSTDFEVLTACLWRSRTIAFAADPDEAEVRMTFIVNARRKCIPPLPAGYYGNACAFAVARSTAGELRGNSLGHAVELIKMAKASVTSGYLQSVANLMVLRGRPPFTVARTHRLSDLTRLGFHEVNFGWGTALYSGPPVTGHQVFGCDRGRYTRFKNSKGDDGILMPVSLPASAMKIFTVEIERLTKEPTAMKEDSCSSTTSSPISQGLLNMKKKMDRNKILNRL